MMLSTYFTLYIYSSRGALLSLSKMFSVAAEELSEVWRDYLKGITRVISGWRRQKADAKTWITNWRLTHFVGGDEISFLHSLVPKCMGSAVAQDQERVVHLFYSWWCDPQLLLSACWSPPGQDTEPKCPDEHISYKVLWLLRRKSSI